MEICSIILFQKRYFFAWNRQIRILRTMFEQLSISSRMYYFLYNFFLLPSFLVCSTILITRRCNEILCNMLTHAMLQHLWPKFCFYIITVLDSWKLIFFQNYFDLKSWFAVFFPEWKNMQINFSSQNVERNFFTQT